MESSVTTKNIQEKKRLSQKEKLLQQISDAEKKLKDLENTQLDKVKMLAKRYSLHEIHDTDPKALEKEFEAIQKKYQ